MKEYIFEHEQVIKWLNGDHNSIEDKALYGSHVCSLESASQSASDAKFYF